MHGCYGSTCTSSCCLSSLFFSAAARWGRFFPPLQDDGNLSTLLKEVKRLNISGVVRVTEYVCMRTRPHLHYLTTGQTTRTIIVVAVCCRSVALYSQENRCCVCECGHLKSATKLQLALKCPDLSIGPIVSETICGVLVKERKAPKYLKQQQQQHFAWL